MSHTPAQQWSALSALYEEADALPAHALPGWLAQLERQGHTLLPQLRRMLEARSQMETDDFLGTLPRLGGTDSGSGHWCAGRRVGPYRLVRALGEGGMAEVWLADRDDGAFRRQVAIKLPYPRPGRETFAARFDRERDILATLRHPHIAGLYDAGVTPEGQAWLALEYVEGQPISAFCDERHLPLRERVTLFRQVLLAVQHAHANLVIHRDLKPANILVTPQGEVRLLDFGIAKLLDTPGDAIEETELTRQAGRSMTPRYASPEQLTGLPLTTACDVYSLGVVFYELMCGERPYELKVESAAQLEHAILEVEPRAMSRRGLTEANAQARGTTVKGLARTLSPELDAIALRCLGKQAASRYSSVDALLADIDRWLAGEAVLARAPGAWYRVRKFTARHRLGVALSASAIVSLAVVAGVAVVLGLQAREESARAGAARDFMLSLFKRADQEKARGADITARELLETGRNDVMTRMSKQPRLQAELLDGIAKIQWDMGEYVGADSTFAAAARIHAELGMSREAALARTAQANSLVRIGDMNLAAMALREAKSIPGRPVDDLELNARMNEVEGWIAFAHREPARAKEFFLNSHAQALKAFGPYHLMTIDALRGRFYAERESRDFDAAMRLLRELEETSRKTAGVGAVGMAALARDRADLLLSAGRVAESLDHVLASLPKCVADLGPNHGECRELEYSKVNAMLLMGKAQQALEDLPTLKVIADDDKAPALGSGTSLLILRLASAMRLPDLTAQWYGRVASLVEPGAKSGLSRSFRTKALLTLAEARLRERDPLGAQRWIGQALDLQRRDDGSRQVTRLAALAKSLQGVALLMQGRADEALQATAAGEADMTKLVGPDDLSAALLSLNAAISLNAVGRHNDALAVVKQAEPVVRKAMGVAAPTYLRLQALLGEIERARTGASAAKDAVRSTTAMDFFT